MADIDPFPLSTFVRIDLTVQPLCTAATTEQNSYTTAVYFGYIP